MAYVYIIKYAGSVHEKPGVGLIRNLLSGLATRSKLLPYTWNPTVNRRGRVEDRLFYVETGVDLEKVKQILAGGEGLLELVAAAQEIAGAKIR